ncbi:flippase [Novosphingopyxis iocasae]|uniref:flippase n=1 Tax=Novosphingopyxis iocasae TaxID=2762729 RepID=UPI0016519545|nr:flippase [Novosphingopyxis iocasae]
MSIARHTVYNLVGAVLPLFVSIVTVPAYLHLIGLERYGVLSVCWLLLGYFGLFDIGLGRAITQQIARVPVEDVAQSNRLFWSAIWLSLGLVVFASLLLVPAAYWGLTLIKFDTAEVAAEVGGTVVWLAFSLPVAMIIGILNGALQGRERFAALNGVDVLSNSLSAIVPLTIAWLVGPTLWMLVAGALGVRVLSAVLLFYFCRRSIPLRRPVKVHRGDARGLLSYGGWVSITSIIGPMLVFWDRFAIGWVIGAAAVSIYVLASTVVQRAAVLPNALTRAMFPRFAYGSDDYAAKIQGQAITFLSVVMTPGMILVMALVHPLLTLWIGADLARQTAPVLLVLLPGIWFNGMAHIPYNYLQATGKPNVVAIIHSVEILPYVGILMVGLYAFGIPGVALAWTLRAVADALLLYSRSLGGLRAMRPVTAAAALLSASTVAALLLPAGSALRWAIMTLLVLGSCWQAYRMHPEIIRRGIGMGLSRVRVLLAGRTI